MKGFSSESELLARYKAQKELVLSAIVFKQIGPPIFEVKSAIKYHELAFEFTNRGINLRNFYVFPVQTAIPFDHTPSSGQQ